MWTRSSAIEQRDLIRSKQLFDMSFDLLRPDVGGETLDDAAVPVDQKFRKVPLDRLRTQKAARLAGQVPIQRMRVLSADVDFRIKRKGDAVIEFALPGNLFAFQRLLVCEL